MVPADIEQQMMPRCRSANVTAATPAANDTSRCPHIWFPESLPTVGFRFLSATMSVAAADYQPDHYCPNKSFATGKTLSSCHSFTTNIRQRSLISDQCTCNCCQATPILPINIGLEYLPQASPADITTVRLTLPTYY